MDLAAETTKNLSSHLKAMAGFDDRDPATITPADVQEWIAGLTLKPCRSAVTLPPCGRCSTSRVSTRIQRGTAGQAAPRGASTGDPPTAAEVETIIATVPEALALASSRARRDRDASGRAPCARVGDVDEIDPRFRVKAGKSAAARRWVAVPE